METNGLSDNTQRQPEQRYTPLPVDNREGTVPGLRIEEKPRQGLFHVQRLPQIASLMAVLVFVFGMSFYMYTTQFTTNTRANSETGPKMVSALEYGLTTSLTSIPGTYKQTVIPTQLGIEGRLLYTDLSDQERDRYIINRIVIYYVLSELEYGTPIVPESFSAMEKEIPELQSRVESKRLDWQSAVQENIQYFQ